MSTKGVAIKGVALKLEHELHEIIVSPGECLTIWTRSTQVEVRVSLAGDTLVFCNGEVHPFSEWEELTARERGA